MGAIGFDGKMEGLKERVEVPVTSLINGKKQ